MAFSTRRYARPLTNPRRESHHVFAMQSTINVNPTADAGAAPAPPRKRTCAASVTSHDSRSPKSAALRIETNAASGAQRSRATASAIGSDDTSTADVGEPARFRIPSLAGAQPLRASEKSVRDAE